ncbi:MAG: hypothetical protein Kow0026_25430 [Oricola sp.]
MNHFAKTISDTVLPGRLHLPLRYYYRLFHAAHEEEMFFVTNCLKSRRRLVDVGANKGMYSYYFRKRMRDIDAFEPLLEMVRMLKPYEEHNLRIHNCALSDTSGSVRFNIPLDEHGRMIPDMASIEAREGAVEMRDIDVRTLDSFGFDDVDLLKIDVEGHELKVLRGARETIRECRPTILVEVEQRHLDFDMGLVFDELLDQGYEGHFIDDGGMRSLSEFDVEEHQTSRLGNASKRKYINNFIFTPV